MRKRKSGMNTYSGLAVGKKGTRCSGRRKFPRVRARNWSSARKKLKKKAGQSYTIVDMQAD